MDSSLVRLLIDSSLVRLLVDSSLVRLLVDSSLACSWTARSPARGQLFRLLVRQLMDSSFDVYSVRVFPPS
jgi:hypothetical protein